MERLMERASIESYFIAKPMRRALDKHLYLRYLNTVRLHYSVRRRIFKSVRVGGYWHQASMDSILQDSLTLISLVEKRMLIPLIYR